RKPSRRRSSPHRAGPSQFHDRGWSGMRRSGTELDRLEPYPRLLFPVVASIHLPQLVEQPRSTFPLDIAPWAPRTILNDASRALETLSPRSPRTVPQEPLRRGTGNAFQPHAGRASHFGGEKLPGTGVH